LKILQGIAISLAVGILSFIIAFCFLPFKIAVLSFCLSVIVSLPDCVELAEER